MAGKKSTAHGGASTTPDAILAAAERLFAEGGIGAVSNRRIAEAAGAANHFAVGYHFGTKENLVLALMRRHIDGMDRLRRSAAEELAGSSDPRGFVAALVRQLPAYLATLQPPTYAARFALQTLTDPSWLDIGLRESATSADEALRGGLRAALRGNDLGITSDVLQARVTALRVLLPSVCAEHERLGSRSRFRSWDAVADFLEDTGCGLVLAPVVAGKRRKATRNAGS
ncbi:TetR/AcrR family transcriptional regulator [Kutzneria sp. NPDC052558]|uniref:TetR/AcrR family transcriptional regulator n=1 Tax=Kutzneria sp. NPDC052558 TaxID=3364121 RepID=UPI0037C69C61